MVSKSKAKKKTNESIKRKLLNSLKENKDVEEQELNETVNRVNNSQDAILITHHYEDIIKTQNKKAGGYIAKQAEIFKKLIKTFNKDNQDFLGNVGQSKSTIYFKILLISFWRNTLCLKHSLYNQVILKLISSQSRLFAKKTGLNLYRAGVA